MATLLSSPLGPSSHNAAKYDIFDQPSSPTLKHAELPAEFGDQSFGSSMSLGSSFELNRMATSSSTSSQLSNLSVSALEPRRFDEQQKTIRLPRKSPPRIGQDSLGAAMGTILNSKSPNLAAKMNSSDYMDTSSPPTSRQRATPKREGEYDQNLPPGSAMKEDTPVKYNQAIRRTNTELAAATSGASLGRLFGTELSINNRHQSFQATYLSKAQGDESFTSQNSPDKEPPSKRRPSSFPLVPAPTSGRPSVRSNGIATSTASNTCLPTRRPGLLKSMTTNQTLEGKTARKRASLEALHQRHRASDSIVPSARTFTMGPPRRSRSGSSEDRDVREGQPRSSLPPLHPTIIESPSPSALQYEDFGTYFFDPQSPEHTKIVITTTSISSRLNSISTNAQTSSRRPFEKSATSAILPSMLTSNNNGSSLGKRANPYAKRPSLSAIQNKVKLGVNTAYIPAASTSNASGSTRMTAPAPRRCQSAIDNSAAFAQAAEDLTMNSVDTSADQSSLMSPSDHRSTKAAAIRQFPLDFNASGSPLAPSARPKLRPGMLRKTSKDDSSPLGYGIGKRLTQKITEGLLVPSCGEDLDSFSLSPLRGAEGLPGFGASEREGKVLPCFNIKDDGLMRITPATLVKVMKGLYSHAMENYQIVDCRFGYEYEGGHIAGAINLSTMEKVKRYFLQPEDGRRLPIRSQSGKPDDQGVVKKQVLIFHCEFSAKRAPSMALALRQADRSLAHDYPNCHYPEVYILQGGYCGFYKEYSEVCEPKHYVQMDDPKFQDKRSKELNGFRKQFSRHRSFTYGDGANAAARLPHSDGNILCNPPLGRPIQEENSFENSKSPSAVQADIAQMRRKGMVKGNHLRIDTIKGLGEKPLLGSAPANIGDISFGSSIGDESSSSEGGPTDSPCAAANNRNSRPSAILLKPGNSKTFSANTGKNLLVAQNARDSGGSLGRHTFQRAATAAHIQLR